VSLLKALGSYRNDGSCERQIMDVLADRDRLQRELDEARGLLAAAESDKLDLLNDISVERERAEQAQIATLTEERAAAEKRTASRCVEIAIIYRDSRDDESDTQNDAENIRFDIAKEFGL